MIDATRYQPFSEIIQRSLAGRGACKNDLDRHPDYPAPRYVVKMCEDLTRAVVDAGNPDVTLADIVRLEATCTGADYAHKLAMRCHYLTLSIAA